MCCAVVVADVNAQSQDTKRTISMIKRDTTYLYAEATMKNLDEAYAGAISILEMKVDEWLQEQRPNESAEVCIAKAKKSSYEVQTQRGEYYRAVVYVKKNEIMPVAEESDVVVIQLSPKDVKSSPNVNNAYDTSDTQDYEEPKVSLTSDEQRIIKINSFYDIEPFINELKGKNKLNGYGKYATMPVSDDCHILVYNKSGSIVASLRKEDGVQINLKTLEEDDVKNYKNCGAIWLQIK